MELKDIKGVGEKIESYLNKLGIYVPSDLLYNFPRDYEEFKSPKMILDLKVGAVETIKVKIVGSASVYRKGKLNITNINVTDGKNKMRASWFNIPYIANYLKSDKVIVLRGKISLSGGRLSIVQPKIYEVEKYNEIENTLSPIYQLTKGIKNESIKNFVRIVLESKKEILKDYLPREYREKRNLAEYDFSIEHIHFPKDVNDMTVARKRLIYDELFIFSLGMFMFKEKTEKGKIDFLKDGSSKYIEKVLKNLDFELTKGQKEAVCEMVEEMRQGKTMNRLLEGDVGSGKTIVAFLVALYVVENGGQVAIMAPTEVLANQHYENLKKIVDINSLNIGVRLLTASKKVEERKSIIKDLEDGSANILIGTHAIFGKDVKFKNLALVVTDEQHRFGVMQRKSLEEKAKAVNVLSMSATPIPRTLAMLLYADMQISRICEKPKNRVPIKNYVITEEKRNKAYELILREVSKGRQAYIICAAIDGESEETGSFANFKNVTDYTKEMKKLFKNKFVIESLTGKMKPKEKEDIMNRFKNGEISILVSTTVVEVGVDCKNATVIMVEDAGRFGLATLHQLRGRVGRGEYESYAIFVDTTNTENSKKRLQVIQNSNDGFFIAEEDLKLRGAGDFFGVKQSGAMEFNIADMYRDIDILKMAAEDAKKYISKEITFDYEHDKVLKCKLDEYIKNSYTI